MSDRDALVAKYGPFTTPAIEDDIAAIRHPSQESAEAFLALEAESDPETPSWVEQRGGEWFRMVDLRPSMARAKQELEASDA